MRKLLIALLILLSLFALASCAQEPQTQGYSPSPVNPDSSNPTTIELASRGWVDIKTVTETIDGVSYSVRHCVNLFTSSDYEYTYYKLCYSGGTLRRVDQYTQCTHELVPYQQFLDHLESASHRLAVDNNIRNLAYSTCGFHMVYLYSSSGKLQEYQSYQDENYKTIYKYNNDGRMTYQKYCTITTDNSGSVKSNYYETLYQYFNTGKIKEKQELKNGNNSSYYLYKEDGSARLSVTYYDAGNAIVINAIGTTYESGRNEYIYNYSNHYLWHYTDSENPTYTKEQYTNSQIEEWLASYKSTL